MATVSIVRRVAFLVAVTIGGAGCAGPNPSVSVLRAPAGASLPQAALDVMGTVHLICYTGSMSSGNLWDVTRELDATE